MDANDLAGMPTFVPDEPLDADRTEAVTDGSDPVLQVGLWDPAGIAAMASVQIPRT